MNALAAKPQAASPPQPVPAPDVRWITIDETHAGQRLDNFLLSVLKGVPKSLVYRIVRSGEVRVDKGRATPEWRLAIGQVVRIPPVRVPDRSSAPPVPGQSFPVIHEDEALLVIDKPAGVAVHGGSGIRHGLIEQVRAARADLKWVELVHRIDRDTSGLLLLAKTRTSLTFLHDLMRRGQVRKRYLAMAKGQWTGPEQALRFPLHAYVNAEGEKRVVVHEAGQPSGTRVRAKRQGRHPAADLFSLLECDMETGRTHQIRVHLAHAGFPILGDDKYGDPALNRRLQAAGHRRMFLHAHKIAFAHPLDQKVCHLEAQMPEAFERLLQESDARL